MRKGQRMVILLAVVVVLMAGLSAGENVHHYSRQREIMLQNRNVDTRVEAEFGAHAEWEAWKQAAGLGSEAQHLFMVHFNTPYAAAHEQKVREDAGVSFIGWLPQNTWLMESTEAEAAKVQDHQNVAWVGAWMPCDKLAPALQDRRHENFFQLFNNIKHDTLLVTLTPAGVSLADQLLPRWQKATQSSIQLHNNIARVLFTPAENKNIHTVGEYFSQEQYVHWIEPEQIYKPLNKWARGVIQSGVGGVEGESLFAKGLRGRDEVVVIGDTGVDMTSCFFEDSTATPFDAVDLTHRKVVSYQTRFGNDVDDFSHGTFVAGQLVGESTAVGGTSAEYNGLIPDAKLFVIDMNDGISSITIPANPDTELFPLAVDAGVPGHVQIYPWGSKSGGYNTLDAAVDRYGYSGDRRFAAFFGAGNDGRSVAGTTSIHTPSSAKNCVSVGVSQNDYESFTQDRPDREMEIIAQDWHQRACGQETTLYTDYGFCASVGRGTPDLFPCQSFQPIFCDQFHGDPDECCLFSYLQPTCCNSTVWSQLLSFPFVYGPETLAWFSSAGPTQDGRIKPDVVAPGQRIYSAEKEVCDYRVLEGSSFSAANAAAAAALVREYFLKGHFGGNSTAFNPSGALVKAMLVNSGQPLKQVNSNDLQFLEAFSGQLPADRYGFGRVQLDRVLQFDDSDFELYATDEQSFPLDSSNRLTTWKLCLDVPANAGYLKVTLVWFDEAATNGAGVAIVNNLDLAVVDDTGYEYRANFGGAFDTANTVEQVFLTAPSAGKYNVLVHPTLISSLESDSRFALVVTGNFATTEVCMPGNICPFACSFRGTCSNNLCTCDTPYGGPDCSLTPCVFGCSGNGYCDPEYGLCFCDEFWQGDDCSVPDPSGSGGNIINRVTEDDNDIAPGVTAGIAIACFFAGLILGGGLASWATIRFILARQKKRIAAFQAKLQAENSSAVPMDEADEDSYGMD